MSEREKLFEQIVEENRHRIYRICRAYLSATEDADDLYQDILLKIWMHLDTFRGEAKLSTWLYRISLNTALLYQKKQKQKPASLPRQVMQLPDGAADREAKQQQEQLLERLHACIALLEKQDRLIISLVLEEVPYKEIAEVLGLTVSHVGVKISRIKQKLATQMEQVSLAETTTVQNSRL